MKSQEAYSASASRNFPRETNDMLSKRYITVKECCWRYSVGKTRLYEEILAKNLIEAVKFGSRTLIDADSAERFFASLPHLGRS